MKSKKLLTAISALALSGGLHAAEITTHPTNDPAKKNVVVVSGEIVKGDFDKFVSALTAVKNNQSWMVFLDGPGGSLHEAMQMGLLIHKLKYDTVAYRGVCSSACAYIWLAGERVIIDLDNNAKVGFHAPYTVDKFGNVRSHNEAAALLGGYLREIGASWPLIQYATSVDGGSMRWLTESDAKAVGLTALFFRKPTNTNPTNNLSTKTFVLANSVLTVPVNEQQQPHGVGLFKLNNGDTDSVTFVNGVRYGPAVYTFANGNTESSNFVKNVKYGPAVFTFANGDKIFFNYIDGKRQGEVRKVSATGIVEVWTIVDNSTKGQSWTRFNQAGQVIASGVFQ